MTLPVAAARLILRIQAANPSDQQQRVEVRSSLPERVSTNDIINLAGLSLGYDVKSDTYYVHGELELGPKEIAVREVELDDIWVLNEQEVRGLAERADQLSGMLAGTPHADDAEVASQGVRQGVESMLSRQAENRITQVSAIRHIQAYEANLQVLQEVRQQLGMIENRVLAAGMSPGERLIGEDKSAADPRRDAHLPTAYGDAVVRITVQNSSPTQTRRIPIRRELPPEVGIQDILDAGELAVGFDASDQVTYVYADAVEIGPMETRTFEIRIRDKWNVNAPRIQYLQEKVDMLRITTADRTGLAAIENMLEDAHVKLEAVREERGPSSLGPAYIAFYRRQADRLDEIERHLNRIDAALSPLETRRGFAIPAPDKRTTWLIIYSILGFLALMSLLFFLRWFVRSS